MNEEYIEIQGIRSEWEGFVAMINKEESKKYSLLFERSEEWIVNMPWNGEYAEYGKGKKGPFEAQTFEKPDYTSLEGKFPLLW